MVLKLGILASGRGTDFQAILDHVNMKILDNVEIKLVIYNNKDATVRDRAEQAGIKTLFIQGTVGQKFESKEQREQARIEFDKQVVEACKNEDVELIVCAGFNQILRKKLLQKQKQSLYATLATLQAIYTVKLNLKLYVT